MDIAKYVILSNDQMFSLNGIIQIDKSALLCCEVVLSTKSTLLIMRLMESIISSPAERADHGPEQSDGTC
jgi:hypothetical protein